MPVARGSDQVSAAIVGSDGEDRAVAVLPERQEDAPRGKQQRRGLLEFQPCASAARIGALQLNPPSCDRTTKTRS